MFALLAGMVGLTGCASGPDADELERRTQLLKLENDNLAHERDGLAKDLEQAKASAAALEQNLAEARKAADECRADDDKAQKQLADAERKAIDSGKKIETLQGQLGQIREMIASGKIDRKKERKKLLQSLREDQPEAGDNTSH
jgi:chromosome segregation ATPase